MAVDRPELSRWADVLIVSTKGEKSFASMLSGGDYDGGKDEFCLDSRPLIFFSRRGVYPVLE
ncbi:hypothetical protein C0989_007138 [Termitomyces sp. Mn162]|nr:hypothetical protein C0989_007138 [Termitomyces sp. Mn162]